ncbi:MAG TPA: c-type cytochrome biogenesis protein CcmI [Burkholderiaceae bacterium]|nr:c-type cytochrome biogenesis protein CcmI [Burkholderiaceae bacterium]
MIAFVLIAALLVAVALAWLLPPLIRRDPNALAHDRVQMNLALLRDQLADLDAEHAGGTLSTEQYTESKAELERRVLEETGAGARASAAAPFGGRATAAVVAATVPITAVVLYVWLGDPSALDLQSRRAELGHSKQPTRQDIDAMLVRLAQRLEREPGNMEGWAMLARSYYVLQQYPEAVRAYEQLVKLAPQEPAVLVDYADALAMRDGRKISGKPLELVQQALKLDPAQPKALAMAGTEAFDREDFRLAVEYWEKLRAVLPPDSEMGRNIVDSIAEARQRGGLGPGPESVAQALPVAPPGAATKAASPAAAASGAASVQGTVRLDPAVAARVAPTDAVFVFARAVEGPRMPLAVFRLQARDLPAKFTLDDSLAMAPNFRLSNFKNVLVNARVSKSGSATPSAGDLEGKGVSVGIGARDVVLTIDRVVP